MISTRHFLFRLHAQFSMNSQSYLLKNVDIHTYIYNNVLKSYVLHREISLLIFKRLGLNNIGSFEDYNMKVHTAENKQVLRYNGVECLDHN